MRGVLGARSLAQTARRRAHLPVELLVVLGRCASLAPLLVELDAIGDQLGHKVVLARPPPRRRVLGHEPTGVTKSRLDRTRSLVRTPNQDFRPAWLPTVVGEYKLVSK